MKSRWFISAGMIFAGAAFCAIVWMTGCTAKAILPVSVFYRATPTPMPTCGILFNGCESLTQNGVWSGTRAVRTLSASHATEGSYSLQAAISSWIGWNDQLFLLDSFAPTQWSPFYQLKVDVYVEPTLLEGSTFCQFVLIGDSATAGKYYCPLTNPANYPGLVPGQQTVTWNLDYWGTGAFQIPAGSAVTKLYLIINTDAPGGTGSAYSITIDNLRLVARCGTPTPQPTPTPPCGVLFNGFESLTENGALVPANMTFSTASLSTLHTVEGTHSLDLNITATNPSGWGDHFFYLSGFTPAVWSTYTTFHADAYVDPSVLANSSYTPQLMLMADTATLSGQLIATSGAAMVAGQQHLVWTLSWTSVPAGTPLTAISFVNNRGPVTGTDGLGHIYLDNFRLCP